jgi:hypothetical protein
MRLFRGVGREELQGPGAALAGRGHANPQVPGRARVVAGLGHVEQPEVVGL